MTREGEPPLSRSIKDIKTDPQYSNKWIVAEITRLEISTPLEGTVLTAHEDDQTAATTAREMLKDRSPQPPIAFFHSELPLPPTNP